MFRKAAASAALASVALLAASPALADGFHRGFAEQRFAVEQPRFPYHAQRPVFVHRPVIVRQPVFVHRHRVAPPAVVVYRDARSRDVLGGLIVGAMLGAVIASQGAY